MGSRRPVRRPPWASGGPSGGRLGRQEVRPEAVLGARSPETSVLLTVRAKTLVLRRRRQATKTQKLPRGQARYEPTMRWSKIKQKKVQKQHPAEAGLKSVLGGSLDRIGAIWVPFGTLRSIRTGVPKRAGFGTNVECLLRSSWGWHGSAGRLRWARAEPPRRGRGGVVTLKGRS